MSRSSGVVRPISQVLRILPTSLILTAVLLSGCAGDFASPGKTTAGKATTSQKIKISGSGSTLPLVKLLVSDYQKRNPSIRVAILSGAHCAGGFEGTASREFDIGTVSRDPKPNELRYGLDRHVLSSDAVALVVHPAVTIRGLTTEQVKQIYSGKITNWRAVGGPNVPIVVLDRNEEECAKMALRKGIIGPKLKITPKAVQISYESDMVEVVPHTPGAIGYFSYGRCQLERIKARVLEIDGVSPSVEHVVDGSYKTTRPMGVVTLKNPPAHVRSLIDYLTGPRAARIMRAKGFAPSQD